VKAKISLLCSLAVGLLVLLATISLAVVASAPRSMLPPAVILAAHESGLYAIDAEIMAKRLLPDLTARWTRAGANCFPVGNGSASAA
jgi:hypothetical protein